MSNQNVRNILNRFAPILHAGWKNGGRSHLGNSSRYGGDIGNEVRLNWREILAWEHHFGIKQHLSQAAERGDLYLDAGEAPKDGGVRINYDVATYDRKLAPILDVSQVTWHLIAYAYTSPGYNAFISMNIYAKAPDGRWILDVTQGTRESVYSPINVVDTGIWFNTKAKEGKPNVGPTIHLDKPDNIMINAELHDLDTVRQIDIQDDPRIHFFFWQLRRMTKPLSWMLFRQAMF